MCDDDDCDELRLLQASNFNQENDEDGNSPHRTKDFSSFFLFHRQPMFLLLSQPITFSSLAIFRE